MQTASYVPCHPTPRTPEADVRWCLDGLPITPIALRRTPDVALYHPHARRLAASPAGRLPHDGSSRDRPLALASMPISALTHHNLREVHIYTDGTIPTPGATSSLNVTTHRATMHTHLQGKPLLTSTKSPCTSSAEWTYPIMWPSSSPSTTPWPPTCMSPPLTTGPPPYHICLRTYSDRLRNLMPLRAAARSSPHGRPQRSTLD